MLGLHHVHSNPQKTQRFLESRVRVPISNQERPPHLSIWTYIRRMMRKGRGSPSQSDVHLTAAGCSGWKVFQQITLRTCDRYDRRVDSAPFTDVPQMPSISKAPLLIKPPTTRFTTGLCTGHRRDYDLVKTKWGENAKMMWGCSSKNNPANPWFDMIYSAGSDDAYVCGHVMLSEPLARSCLNRFSTVIKSA